MQLIHYIASFLAMLGILVVVHEFGHYLVGRISGVRILRFAVGIGPVVWSRRDSRGTEFAVCAIPIGGYVRMYDARDPEAAPEEGTGGSYDRLSVPWRIGIALGGPVANFLLAIAVYATLAGLGTMAPVPLVGEVRPDGPAHAAGIEAGSEIRGIDDRVTQTWQDVQLALADRLGESGIIGIRTSRPGGVEERLHEIRVRDWLGDVRDPDMIDALGFSARRPAVVGEILDGTPAARAGLRPWDRIVRIDGEVVADWSAFERIVRAAPGQTLAFELEDRAGGLRSALLAPEPIESADGETFGRIGVAPPMRITRFGPLAAVGEGVRRTWATTGMTFDLVGKMIKGLVSTSNLSGPITIARVAGDSVDHGAATFLATLALLSVSLGVLNLLPIPVLDGGHVLYCLVELAAGRRASEWFQLWGAQIGFVMVVGLMMLAFYNDIVRLL